MRRAAKRDANERAIISTWEAMGAYVESVSGPGLADTLVHHKGRLFRAEVKGAKNGLTEKQVENFRKAWDAGVSTYVMRTPADARSLLLGSVERLRLEWRPEMGALAGADRKERPFRPGTDRARSLLEMCTRYGCITSQAPGQNVCAAHAAEVFAPPELADSLREPSTVKGAHKLGTNSRATEIAERAAAMQAGRFEPIRNYTPPRSTPVDAAKEAEVFAPPEEP